MRLPLFAHNIKEGHTRISMPLLLKGSGKVHAPLTDDRGPLATDNKWTLDNILFSFKASQGFSLLLCNRCRHQTVVI